MTHDFVHSPPSHTQTFPQARLGSSGDLGPCSKDSNVHLLNDVMWPVNKTDCQSVDDVIVQGGGDSANKQLFSKRTFNSLSDDPCDFPDDNEVIVSMLETFGQMSAHSQAAGMATQFSPHKSLGESLTSVLTDSDRLPSGSCFYGSSSPLDVPRGRGGRSRSRPFDSAQSVCALPGQQSTEGGLLPQYYAGEVETTGKYPVSPGRHCEGSHGHFQGWHSSTSYGSSCHSTRTVRAEWQLFPYEVVECHP